MATINITNRTRSLISVNFLRSVGQGRLEPNEVKTIEDFDVDSLTKADIEEMKTLEDQGRVTIVITDDRDLPDALAELGSGGEDYLDSILDRDLSTPPASPTAGDRYLVKTAGTGAWLGHDEEVTEWDGQHWVFTDLSEGQTTWVEDENLQIFWNGAAWQTAAAVPMAHTLGGAAHSADTLANLNAKVSDATLIDTGDARLSDARTPTAHNLGGAEHSADTLANLNTKVSDATLIDTGDARLSDARTPTAHNLGGAEHSADTLANLNAKVSDATLDDSSATRTPAAHNLGGAEHSADTLANLNAKVSDATLDDSSSARTPSAHNLGGAEHSADTLANLNAKVSDATLDDSSATRTPSAHNLGGAEHSADTIANLNTKVSDATIATAEDSRFKRETTSFFVSGTVSTGTEQAGAWEAPAAGAITRVTAYRKSTAGTSGSTIVDVNIGGTTIFTTQSNRPDIAFNDGDGKDVATTIEAGTLAQGDLVTMDVDQIDTGGSPSDLSVIVTVEYSA